MVRVSVSSSIKTMQPKILLFIVSLLAVASTNPIQKTNQKTENKTLVLVHALFRHGNRTPDKLSQFPNDPYLKEPFAPYGLSQLTKKGKLTEYNIGKWMRENYGDLIPQQYTKDVVYAITTNFKRTKMSLELVLAGLFPPLESDKFVSSLEWQPIPYNIETDDTTIIQIPLLNCLHYVNLLNSYTQSKEALAIMEPYRPLYKNISELTGNEIRTPSELGNIYFTLTSEIDFGLKLPEWTKNYYPEVLEEATSVYYEFATANTDLEKFTSGSLLKKIIDDTKDLIAGSLPTERKLFLYSAHEFNVAAILRGLNVFYRHVPPFGATVFFEVHKINQQYAFQIFYQNYEEANPILLNIPGCGNLCTVEQLEQLLEPIFRRVEDVCVDESEL